MGTVLDEYIFDTIARSTSQTQQAQQNIIFSTRRPSRHRTALQTSRVEAFLASPRLLLRQVPVEQQMALLARLRTFLLDHYEAISFESTIWQQVVLVLAQHSELQITGQKSTSKSQGSINAELYHVRREGSYTLVTIPTRFRPRQLLDFLHTSLPGLLVF
jgi:hypothetical protein